MSSRTERTRTLDKLTERISNRYLVVTMAIFLAVGVPAYLYLSSAVRDQFSDNYADFSTKTAEVFENHLHHEVTGQKFAEPLSGELLEHFEEDTAREVEHGNLLKVKVWRPDGMLLYNSVGGGVGNVREISGGFAQAVDGAIFTKFATVADVAGDEDLDALEIYMPAYTTDGELANVFELYYSLAPLDEDVAATQKMLLLFLGLLMLGVAAIGAIGARMLVKRNRRLHALSLELEHLAETDGLTGIANHRHFRDRLKLELSAAKRYGRRLSLVMIDLDFFKKVNDQYGHQTGDQVLREVAQLLAGSVRDVDLVARYGGEEFAVMLPEASERDAAVVADRLHRVVHDLVVSAGHAEIDVTASFGVAEFPAAAEDADSLVAASDSALYFAKKQGRDMVCCFSQLGEGSADENDVDRLFNRLRHAGVFTVQALAAAVTGTGDEGVHFHSGSPDLAHRAGEALKLSAADREALALAASVYDVGKIAVPDEVLSKPEALTDDEARAIRAHPETSEKILAAIGGLEKILMIVRYHHERYDGSGYPEGLVGEEIPYLARVLQVIDAYQAMITHRPYRDAMTPEEAMEELRANAGTQFDPKIVEELVNSVLKGKGEKRAAEVSATPAADEEAQGAEDQAPVST